MAWSQILQDRRMYEGDRPLQPIILSEEAVGNSKLLKMDRDLPGRMIEIFDIRIEYTATGTAGTREITLEILDREDDIVFSMHYHTDTDVIASTTEILQLIRGQTSFVTAVDAGPHRDLLPILFLGPGDQLQIRDRAAVAAGDTCLVHIRGNLL